MTDNLQAWSAIECVYCRGAVQLDVPYVQAERAEGRCDDCFSLGDERAEFRFMRCRRDHCPNTIPCNRYWRFFALKSANYCTVCDKIWGPAPSADARSVTPNHAGPSGSGAGGATGSGSPAASALPPTTEPSSAPEAAKTSEPQAFSFQTSITVHLMDPAKIPPLRALAAVAVRKFDHVLHKALIINPRQTGRLLGEGMRQVAEVLMNVQKEFDVGSFNRPESYSRPGLFPLWVVHRRVILGRQDKAEYVVYRHAHMNPKRGHFDTWCGCDDPDLPPSNPTPWVKGRWNTGKDGNMKWQKRWGKSGLYEWGPPDDDTDEDYCHGGRFYWG